MALHRLTQADVDSICLRHEQLWDGRQGGARAVFGHSDLSGLDLSDRNLIGADFTACRLAGADLRGARMAGARLDFCQLDGAIHAPLVLANGTEVRLDLSGASLSMASLGGFDLSLCKR